MIILKDILLINVHPWDLTSIYLFFINIIRSIDIFFINVWKHNESHGHGSGGGNTLKLVGHFEPSHKGQHEMMMHE